MASPISNKVMMIFIQIAGTLATIYGLTVLSDITGVSVIILGGGCLSTLTTYMLIRHRNRLTFRQKLSLIWLALGAASLSIASHMQYSLSIISAALMLLPPILIAGNIMDKSDVT